ncbi:molybdopterin synthase catalytic subunit MoaE [Zophobihabitans entericus]|uniref:Molybdopterin synthase catalytic subunit n=1 Tax=Zophobihabitans entericus TaxID=1635327 RepID=A0A6G9IDX0_9GAMM|nr:molybdopterin synthase catalytic subunit MoaE [Zophobihabitans entericus]QIQ21780.1 molybdopterin synthase catalytic subunit MoaE [Zophobihabitans entericus]
MNRIVVNCEPFDVNELYQWLSSCPQDGAIVTFTGKVRKLESETISLFLEHYAGMTEAVLEKIIQQARARWSLNRVVVIHRIGEIQANESIVFVGVSSAHRTDSFAAAEFIMDVLKTEAPFWKREKTPTGESWVEAKNSDQESLKKWQ